MATGRIEEFATLEQIDEYNKKAGNASSADKVTVGTGDSAITRDRYPQLKREQAKFRAERHFIAQYWNDYEDKFKLNKDGSGQVASALDELDDDVKCDNQEILSIMAGLELETPGYFASNVNLSADQQLKKLAVLELYEVKHGSIEERVANNRGRSNEVNQIANKYTKTDLLNPTPVIPASDTCPSSSVIGIISISGA